VREGGGLGWNGSAAGFRAYADHDGETGVSVIVASNLTSGALDLVREALPKPRPRSTRRCFGPSRAPTSSGPAERSSSGWSRAAC
jgi:hypothetical protein